MAACPTCRAENPEGSRFCNTCGERMLTTTPAGEVRKTVTVVFCDVVGSTALGEQLDPEALRRVMSRYFGVMTEAIERHGGTVEKFIGYAVMAVFGVPTAREDDAVRAVRAAADMQEALRLINKELERDHGATLTCRIGVSTGEIVAGNQDSRQALVTGDAVNVAARLEQNAPPGEVLIAETTLRLVRDAVVVDPVESLELKGKRELVPAYRLVALHAGVAGVARRLDSPLVGRKRQLDQLSQAFDEVTADRVCHLFTVLGPPGVGKSRLVQEAIEGIAESATVLRGRCLSYGEGITYWPLAGIVRDAISPAGADDPVGAIASLLAEDPSAAEVAARVGQLVGETGDLSIPGEEIGWAVRRFFEGLSKTHPLVVVIDDLQWAQPRLLDLVDQVTELSHDSPILMICVARPDLHDVRPDWGGWKAHATTITLEPLSSDESNQLVENLIGGDGLDPVTRQRITDVAEGNPLFVEETIAMLVDDNVVRREGDHWMAEGDLAHFNVPPTIQALLAARIDRLEANERVVLGRASIVGQVFYLDAVREMTPEAERRDTTQRILQLMRRDFVRPHPSDIPGQDAFQFHYGLLHDAAYGMLPKETRAQLHEQFAAWLERHQSFADMDEFVGHHLERAHTYRTELGPEDGPSRALAARAAECLSTAAARAFDRADSTAAENLSRRAAALRDADDPRRAWDLIALGWTLMDESRADDMSRAFDEALRIAAVAREERCEAHAALGRGFAAWLADPEGGADALTELVERLIPRFEAWDDQRGLAIAHVCRSQAHSNACRWGLAREDCARAIPHARAASAGTFERMALIGRATAGVYGSAAVEKVISDTDELERQAESFPSLRGFVLDMRSEVSALLGDVDEARRLRDSAHAVYREFIGREPTGEFERSWRIETLAGDAAAAETWIRKGYELCHSFGDVAHASTQAVYWAMSCYELGRFQDAWRLAEECRETSASDDVANQFLWRAVEGKLLAREGRSREAEATSRDAVKWVQRTDALAHYVNVFSDQAEVAAMAGSPDDARAALTRALDAAERKGATVLIERTERRIAALDTR